MTTAKHVNTTITFAELLVHLNITPAEWSIISYKQQDRLWAGARKEILRRRKAELKRNQK